MFSRANKNAPNASKLQWSLWIILNLMKEKNGGKKSPKKAFALQIASRWFPLHLIYRPVKIWKYHLCFSINQSTLIVYWHQLYLYNNTVFFSLSLLSLKKSRNIFPKNRTVAKNPLGPKIFLTWKKSGAFRAMCLLHPTWWYTWHLIDVVFLVDQNAFL